MHNNIHYCAGFQSESEKAVLLCNAEDWSKSDGSGKGSPYSPENGDQFDGLLSSLAFQ